MNLFELFKSNRKAIMEGIDHPEDLIISQGSAGAERVLSDLASLEKDPSTVSVKWDGFPAVVFGRDKAGNLVFMDKHMYDKVVNGKMEFMSIKDYDASRDANRANLWEKESVLRPALDRIIPNVKDQYWMGDLMWTGTPPTENGYFVFKPNTVEYRVKIDDTPGRGNTLSDQIARSIGGIAVHTFIPGLGQADQPLVGLKGLKENEGVVFLVGEMRDKPRVAISPDLLAQTKNIVSQHKQAVDKFISDLTAMKGKTVISAMSPFITRMLEEEDISGDIVPRFLEFLGERLTPAAAQKMLGSNKDGWLYQEDGGAPGLLGVWTMWAAITELKNHIKQQIDTQQQGSEIIAITDGVNAHEGYVFGAGKDKLKLIDRLGFSRANFAKHRVSPEEVEQKSKMPMASFCFGRMNPPTMGHGLVINKTLEVGGDKSFIFLSNSVDPSDNPIDPATKAAFIEQIYPQAKGHIVKDFVQGPIYAANWLYNKGYRNMTFVAGSDRLGKEKGSIEKLLNSWNSGPIRSTDPAGAREHVVINFVSSGQRDPDAEGVTGYSGTKARQAAAEGNEQKFQQYTGVGPDVVVNGKTLYQATREGMGIADAKPTAQPAPVKQQPQQKVQVTKKVPGKAPVNKEVDTMNETPLRDKEDLKAKRKALQDIQLDPNTHQDPQLKAELIRRKAALEKEAEKMKLSESIINALGVMEEQEIMLRRLQGLDEDNFGTEPKREKRPGSRPDRGHESKKRYVTDRKTGKQYDPDEEFDKLKNSPEFQAQMKRMAQKEGYSIGRGIDRDRYQERPGLEGPFATKSGKVVYYDKVEGKYYDPDTDMYIEYDDWQAMNEQGVAEGIEIVDQDSDLDQQVYTLNVDGNKVSFTYWDYENNFQSPDIKDIYQQATEQLGRKLSPDQIKDVARAVFKSFEQGVAEGKDPCWKDYKQIGMKKKGRKQVPNCVPKESHDHISPSGVKTNMPPTDDDYAINYGKNGLVAKDRKARGVDVATGTKKLKENRGISKEKETAFHAKLDKLVHNTFGKRDDELEEAPIEMDPQNPNDPMVMPPGLNPGKLSYRKARAAAQLADLARMAAQANEKNSAIMWDAIVKHFPELETNIRSIQHGMQELEKVRRQGGVKSRGIDKV